MALGRQGSGLSAARASDLVGSSTSCPAGIVRARRSKFMAKLAVTIPSEPIVWHLYSITQAPGRTDRDDDRRRAFGHFRLGGQDQGSEARRQA